MFVLLKPRTLNGKSEYFGTLDAVVAPHKAYLHGTDEYVMSDSWMPFNTFDEAFAYLTEELNGDPRYFIFEWVGTEYGRLPSKQT